MSDKAKVVAQIVDDLFPEDGKKVPGAFKFWEGGGDTGLNFWCPCGCEALLGVRFGPGGWTWDGNREKPTVTPSILHRGGCGWHGYLTKGEFIPC